MSFSAKHFLTFSLLLVLTIGCKKDQPPTPKPEVVDPAAVAKEKATEARISNLIKSEDLILDLTPRLSRLADWFERSSAGDVDSSELQSDLATLTESIGLVTARADSVFHTDPNKPSFIETGHWPVESASKSSASKSSASKSTASKTNESKTNESKTNESKTNESKTTESKTNAANPWQAIEVIDGTWETMKFGVVAGDFLNDDRTEFKLHTKVEARGSSKDGWLLGMKGYQDLFFTKVDYDWVLTKWIQEDFYVERSRQTLFREVLSEVVADPEALEKAQRSYLDEIILDTSKTGSYMLPRPDGTRIRNSKYSKWTTMTSDHVYPSVAVVDYNNDGWDDLFLTARWGPTQLLENQGDGTFVDVAEKVGLLEPYLVNCVLFIDTDNDGDKDLIMGRSLEPAKYFRNDDGKFVDATDSHSDLGKSLQYFTSGIAASDVNRDGLIDVYLSSYPPLNKRDTAFEHHFLSAKERKIYLEKRKAAENWVGTAGSANVLLMNRGGGRLERVPFDDTISQWRRSYQPVWSDVDNDGDDDLYVCNDFGPDALLRNDTPKGAKDPVFADVTTELMANKGIGFGMGASFGDFDRDGDLDLYVSNMFSKAGTRIVKKMDSVDPRIQVAAAGCFLFVNDDGKFDQRAGSSTDQFHVNQVGWSYGGQWSDFDNDGQLDLYVPTGFYTAPKEIDTQVDL